MDGKEDSIINLEDILVDKNRVSQKVRRVFNDIFAITHTIGIMEIPPEFEKSVVGWFKKVNDSPDQTIERVKNQKVIRIYNKIVYEGAAFNELRAQKFGVGPAGNVQQCIGGHVKETVENCDFCHGKWDYSTAYDSGFDDGRIHLPECITASNSAKYDGMHGMILFKWDHNPLNFERKHLIACYQSAEKWFEVMYNRNKKTAKKGRSNSNLPKGEFIYPVIGWNCLEKSGASQVHGHMHLMMGKDFHYTEPQKFQERAGWYQERFGRDYFEDLKQVYANIGLSVDIGKTTVLADLTPKKEKGITILLDQKYRDSFAQEIGNSIYEVLNFYRNAGVISFNVAVILPPIVSTQGWENFPYIVRLVDRGRITSLTREVNSTSDIGVMEMFVNNIIESDPYKVIAALKNGIGKKEK